MSDELDDAIELAEAKTGIRRQGAAVRACSDDGVRTRGRGWSAAEEAFILEQHGKMSEQDIADHLHRTRCALHIHIEREMHLQAPSKKTDILTGEHVAMGLGLDSKSVHRLMDAGLMPGRRLPMKDVIRVVDRRVFLLWISEPGNWCYFKPDRVGATRPRGKRGFTSVYDFAFWEDARLMVMRAWNSWRDEWMTPVQVARLLNHPASIKAHRVNLAINRGLLKAVRWGNWWILRSEAEKFDPCWTGHRTKTTNLINCPRCYRILCVIRRETVDAHYECKHCGLGKDPADR